MSIECYVRMWSGRWKDIGRDSDHESWIWWCVLFSFLTNLRGRNKTHQQTYLNTITKSITIFVIFKQNSNHLRFNSFLVICCTRYALVVIGSKHLGMLVGRNGKYSLAYFSSPTFKMFIMFDFISLFWELRL